MKHFVSIGECMVELSDQGNGLLRRGFAGDTFNTAWYARRLLADDWQISYLTAVGDDALSAEMLDFMASEGIDTRLVQRIEGAAPGLYMISLKNGERSFSYWRDTSAAKRLAADQHHLRQALASANIVFLSGITLAILPPDDAQQLIAAAREAGKAGALVAFDTNYRPRLWKGRTDTQALMLQAAAAAQVVLPGFDDETAVFGPCDAAAIGRRYLEAGAKVIVVKDGARGATVFEGRTTVHVAAVAPPEVVDTTAAGDSFCASFLARYVQGDSAVKAAQFAARIAAQVVARRGALVPVSPSSGS